jgi:hypothetical protein
LARLQRHVLPTLASLPLDNIKPKAIITLLTPIANKGSLETVKRLCRNINEIVRLGVAQGIIEINYLADITKLFAAPKKTNMATIKPERLPELITALRDANLLRTTRFNTLAVTLHDKANRSGNRPLGGYRPRK